MELRNLNFYLNLLTRGDSSGLLLMKYIRAEKRELEFQSIATLPYSGVIDYSAFLKKALITHISMIGS